MIELKPFPNERRHLVCASFQLDDCDEANAPFGMKHLMHALDDFENFRDLSFHIGTRCMKFDLQSRFAEQLIGTLDLPANGDTRADGNDLDFCGGFHD
jgi:hypothetical protein